MVIRRNGSTGEQFYGCTMYPQCDATVPIETRTKPDYPDWAKTNE